ncbi:MAG: hypothetical protein EXQ90_07300 [Rhodospirillales bacterium]|nr:hypothetical protein [Rhodospirillales bacterium]
MDAMMSKRIALLALAYAVFGWLGLQLAIPPGYATAIFPASGLALAALLTCGLRYAPGIWIGSFVLNASVGALAIGGLSTTGIAVAASIAVGSTLQAVISAWLVRQWVHQSIDVEEAGAVFRFLVVGGPLGCLISPTWGVTTLWLPGVITPSDVLYTGLNWWIGDSIGVIVVAPLALMVLRREAGDPAHRHRCRPLGHLAGPCHCRLRLRELLGT